MGPSFEVRTGGGAGDIDEGVVPENWVVGVWGDENYRGHERVVFMKPDSKWDERSGTGDVEFSGEA